MPDTAQRYGPEVELDDPAFIHPTVLIHGKVRVGKGVSIWPYTVIRAENFEVVIGEHTNIQDFSMIHVGHSTGAHIGAHCSITHRATVHGARIGDNCLVGIGATLMDGVEIGENSIVGARALVTEGTRVPANSIVVGAPAKVIKSRNNWVANRFNAWLYSVNGRAYAEGDHRRWDRADFAEEARHKMRALEEEFERLYDGGRPAEGDL